MIISVGLEDEMVKDDFYQQDIYLTSLVSRSF